MILDEQGHIRPVGLFILFLCGAVSVTGVRFVNGTAWASPPVAQLQCFEGFREGYVPGTGTLDLALTDVQRSQPDLLSREKERRLIADVKAAEAPCAVGNCPPEARDAYRKAINAFIGHRLAFIEELDVRAGRAGARFAAARLRTGEDLAILRAFNERRHARVYVEGSRRDLVITHELVLRGSIEQLVPCGRVSAA